MRGLAALLVPVLAGCASPSVPMLQAERTRVAVAGLDYVVHHTATRAEAVRVTPIAGLAPLANLALAQAAIESASGCAVRPGTLYGDRVLAEALLQCPDAAPERLDPLRVWGRPDGLPG